MKRKKNLIMLIFVYLLYLCAISVVCENKKVKQEPNVVVLNSKNFNKIVMDPSKNVLVEFYTSFCKKCRSLAPVIELVGEQLKPFKDCIIGIVDICGQDKLVNSLKIYPPYPKFRFYSAYEKKAFNYIGKVDVRHLLTYMSKKCGITIPNIDNIPETDVFASNDKPPPPVKAPESEKDVDDDDELTEDLDFDIDDVIDSIKKEDSK